MKSLLAVVGTCCLLLVACVRDQAPTPPKQLESERQALEKAKTVDNTVRQQAEQQRQDVDQQTQ